MSPSTNLAEKEKKIISSFIGCVVIKFNTFFLFRLTNCQIINILLFFTVYFHVSGAAKTIINWKFAILCHSFCLNKFTPRTPWALDKI